MRQLLQKAPLDRQAAERVGRLLDEATAAASPAVVTPTLFRILLGLAEQTPLVIAVDDADHADPASIDFLLYLSRRLRSTPIQMILVQPVMATESNPFQAEMARQPSHLRLRLPPLSVAGTRDILAQHLPAATAERLAPAAWAVTGGNPALIRSLVDDQIAAGDTSSGLVVRTAFREAFVSCLHRCDSRFLQVASALAALGGGNRRSAVTRLAEVDSFTVDQVIETLAESGLLAPDGTFRHPEARTAVLRCGSERSRVRHYQQAASILHEEGASAAEVAECLLAAGNPPAEWAGTVLREAARLALTADDPELASRHLRLAHQACTDEDEKVAAQAQLATVEWQLDPVAATRHLPTLVTAAGDGRLDQQWVPSVIQMLAWHGEIEEAVGTLEAGHARTPEPEPGTAASLDAAERYLAYLYPDVPTPHAGPAPIVGASGVDRVRSAFTLVRAALRDSPIEGSLAAAEELLQSFEMSAGPVPGEAVMAALETLLYTDALEQAEKWAAIVHEEAGRRAMPTWQAVFAAIRAEVAFRRGDLVAAVELSQEALTRMPPAGWGVTIGAPLSTHILASTARGDRHLAALDESVPAEMMRTPMGVRYLYARGRHYLATNRLRAALADFLSCGRLMQSWQMDQPALAPWRAEAATTLLHLGRLAEARELAEQEVSRSTERRTRSRALALRALGLTSSPPRCAGLLTEAVEIFEECGDRLELAHTLKGLGEAHRATGDVAQARMMLHRANQVVADCGAEVIQRRISPYRHRPADRPGPAPDDAAKLAELSEAERRVALLAAHGLTNREISSQLYITMSTVEQHLTRVYRKLSIRSRTDLLRGLGSGLAQTA